MNPIPTAPTPAIAALGHLAGFLGASFLIDRLWRATGFATDLIARRGGSAFDATAAWTGLPLPTSPGGIEEWPLALLQGAIIPATLEELFFRGLVFEFVRRSKGEIWAIGMSAALFGLAHPGLAHPAAAGLLGLYLGTLRARWGLALPIAAHAANNALGLALDAFRASGSPLLNAGWGSGPTDPWIWVAIGFLGNSAAKLRQEMRCAEPTTVTGRGIWVRNGCRSRTGPRPALQPKPAQDENGM